MSNKHYKGVRSYFETKEQHIHCKEPGLLWVLDADRNTLLESIPSNLF